MACLERALTDAQEKAPANLQLRAKIMGELGNVWVQLGHTERGVELYQALHCRYIAVTLDVVLPLHRRYIAFLSELLAGSIQASD